MNQKITNWIKETVESGSWERYNSLHIDEIEDEYCAQSKWFEGGVSCLKQAFNILDDLQIKNVKVFLLISLKGHPLRKGVNFKDSSDIEYEFDSTPPSLYLYKEDWSGYVETIQEGEMINDSVLNIPGLNFFHIEYKEEGDTEFRRSIMVLLKAYNTDINVV